MKKNPQIKGIQVALVTPFTEDGSRIDEPLLRAHIERLVAAGVHGIVPTGSTGEFTALTLEEHKRVTEVCVEAAAGRITVIPGTGSIATKNAVELSRHASEAGADAIMVVPPFYEGMSPQELSTYLRDISDVVDVPIVYYNIPGATGVKLSPEELSELSKLDGVRYLKDTSGDAVALGALLSRYSDRITAFNGWDTLTFYGLAAGAEAAIWGAANFIPELAVQLWEAVAERKDLEAGRQLWAKIWPICDFLESHNYCAGIKAGLDVVGHSAGPARRPTLALGTDECATLVQLLKSAGVAVA
ncbi:dihydrodipicolinate synthase family protein [Streptomyces iranensis]|uniref:Dihydrodipicolinate synthase n=1 Tax=Streptomyces iranensis TaxID=576784 RepID=A0A060ZBJ8_9ACTN|nr:dihydrodipicolinate synthase family protein [Streptomyces iranensis]MBP2063395.1 dihydrodipicolinate synthase/N-acetylneuraminate lyase [Streptomyces iranensis]CDR01592.1 dihydrodipicolinate synthase [Streptomyces iranensis]